MQLSHLEVFCRYCDLSTTCPDFAAQMTVQNAKNATKPVTARPVKPQAQEENSTSAKPSVPHAGQPEPVSSTENTDDGEDDEENGGDALITPPASVKKGPTVSKAPAAKAPAASAKRSSGVVKKSGAVNGSNVEDVKANAKSGANTKLVKGDSKPSNGLGTAKGPSNPTDAQKSAVATTVDDKSASIMDPA